MPSGSDEEIVFSLGVLSGQSCNPSDRIKTLPDTHGQNTDIIRNARADNAESYLSLTLSEEII